MATIVDWPTTGGFQFAQFALGLQVNEALARGFYTGNLLSQRSAQADRMTCIVTLPPCTREQAGEREGYLLHLRSQRLWMRFGMPQRPVPLGTLRGTPTTSSSVLAGATSIPITTTAGATMRPGDFLSVGTNTLLMAGIPGATANGGGAMTLPLAMPCPVAITSGALLTWDRPKGLWEWDGDAVQIDYVAPVLQQGVALQFRQVIQA